MPEIQEFPAHLETWDLTWHARRRVAERGVDLAEVLPTADHPQQTYTSYEYGEDVRTYRRGALTLAVNPVKRTIITVLLRQQEQWTDADRPPRPTRSSAPLEQRRLGRAA